MPVQESRALTHSLQCRKTLCADSSVIRYSGPTKIKIISKNDFPQIWREDKILCLQNLQCSPRAGASDVTLYCDHYLLYYPGAEFVCPGVQCDEAPGVRRDLRHQGPQHGVQSTQVHTRRRWDETQKTARVVTMRLPQFSDLPSDIRHYRPGVLWTELCHKHCVL